MDIFTWSIPFVAEKITEMLYHILKSNQEEGEDSDEEITPQDMEKLKVWQQYQGTGDKDRANALKSKIKFIGRMMKFQKVLREESENIMKLKGQCPDKKIPVGLLTEGRQKITD